MRRTIKTAAWTVACWGILTWTGFGLRTAPAEGGAAAPVVDEFAPEVRPPAPKEIPKGPTRYLGREIAQTMHYLGAPWLVRESRQREEDCDRMFAALKLKPGSTVCDLGCGNGFYTLRMAKAVGPQGVVYGIDIQREMLRLLKERAAAERIGNLKLIQGSLIDPFLPEGKLDLILMVDVYHEFSHPVQMLAALRKSLAPEGRLALVEFRGEDPKVPIKPLHKMTKKQILKEFEPNGFELAEQFDDLPWQHLMFFKAKPPAAEDRPQDKPVPQDKPDPQDKP